MTKHSSWFGISGITCHVICQHQDNVTMENKTKIFQPFYFHITVKQKLQQNCPTITIAYNTKKIPEIISETSLTYTLFPYVHPHYYEDTTQKCSYLLYSYRIKLGQR